MVGFFRKMFPDVDLPTPDTLSELALYDVYITVHSQVKDMLRVTVVNHIWASEPASSRIGHIMWSPWVVMFFRYIPVAT